MQYNNIYNTNYFICVLFYSFGELESKYDFFIVTNESVTKPCVEAMN